MKIRVLLSGVVGSRAYGLDHGGSDTDRMGIYAAPTGQLLGLSPPPDSLRTTRPDVVVYELRKFVLLALGGNPTVMELLWLPAGLYEKTTLLGQELIEMRQAFLSAPRVRAAYLGYADRQLAKLGAGPGGQTRPRRDREKAARHLARLLHQGLHLYTTGRLTVRLDPETADRCRVFATRVSRGDRAAPAALIAQTREQIDATVSPLPQQPDHERVDAWLRQARRRLWSLAGPDVHRPAAAYGVIADHGR